VTATAQRVQTGKQQKQQSIRHHHDHKNSNSVRSCQCQLALGTANLTGHPNDMKPSIQLLHMFIPSFAGEIEAAVSACACEIHHHRADCIMAREESMSTAFQRAEHQPPACCMLHAKLAVQCYVATHRCCRPQPRWQEMIRQHHANQSGGGSQAMHNE